MFFFQLATLFIASTVFFTCGYSKLLLTPKNGVKVNDHSLDVLADFGEFLVYTSNIDTSMQSLSTYITENFDVEEDRLVSVPKPNVSYTMAPYAKPWHLGRVANRLNKESAFPYNVNGSCHQSIGLDISSYVIDTGIDTTHEQFGGRARWGENFVDELNSDCHGHGTHVAGLIGSRDYGVCVDAKLVAVKVLDCQGSGTLSGVIKGMEWVFKEHTTPKSKKKSIINMSLGGGYSSTINKVVEHIVTNAGDLYVVVAAGNENQDACETSPASSEYAMTIMASNMYDERAWFSNWGSCAYMYAPGVDILSLAPGNSTAIMSGTSMATPVFVGVLNHYVDMYPKKNNTAMKKFMSKWATKNVIHGEKPNTVNRLAYFARI